MAYTVYMHTAPNGKVYIGMTGSSPEKRWNGGHGYRNNPYFWNTIVKYGWCNIKHDILFSGLTKKEAEQKEIELIAAHKSTNPAFGFNCENGGSCAGRVSEKTKQKISVAMKGKQHKPMSDETRRKISEHRKGKTPNRDYGHLSAETREKISHSKKGAKMPAATLERRCITQGKRVMCIETGATFNAIKEAAEATGAPASCISGVCKGARKTAGGYHWKYITGEK